MPDRHDSGCIYCGSPGPFTDEHVVSAGLGGDDSGWLLKGLVCGVCNTDVFSRLETKFLRSSGAAMARLFLQEKGRGRGSKASTPSIDADLTYFHEPSTGMLLVARLVSGGQPITLPQIIARYQEGQAETAVTGGDHQSVGRFLTMLDDLLHDDQIPLVEKYRDRGTTWYSSTPLTWNGRIYTAGGSKRTTVVPKRCIWFEERIRPATVDPKAILPSSVFRRPEGQIVCRVPALAGAVALLSFLRLNPQVRKQDVATGESQSVERPDIHLRYAPDPKADRRVLAKIGINLSAFILGPETVRDRAFDDAVDYARTGRGSIADARTMLDVLPAGSSLDRHVLALLPSKTAAKRHAVLFHSQLYGGPVECLQLAEFEEPPPGLSEAVIVLVDYQTHRIDRSTKEAYELLLAGVGGSEPTG